MLLVLSPASAQTNTNQVTVAVQSTNQIRSVTAVVESLEKRVHFNFGLDRVPALQRLVFGVPAYQYLASLIYVFLGILHLQTARLTGGDALADLGAANANEAG